MGSIRAKTGAMAIVNLSGTAGIARKKVIIIISKCCHLALPNIFNI